MQEIIEKKAKEYSSSHARQYYHHDKYILTSSEEEVYQAFLAGGEFSYYRGYHDAEEDYMNVISSQQKLVDESRMKAEAEIEQLKRTIVKMQCCTNCKHSSHGKRDVYGECYCCDVDMCECKISGCLVAWKSCCDNWRLKE